MWPRCQPGAERWASANASPSSASGGWQSPLRARRSPLPILKWRWPGPMFRGQADGRPVRRSSPGASSGSRTAQLARAWLPDHRHSALSSTVRSKASRFSAVNSSRSCRVAFRSAAASAGTVKGHNPGVRRRARARQAATVTRRQPCAASTRAGLPDPIRLAASPCQIDHDRHLSPRRRVAS
jgi:hypothetical protein